MDAVDRHIASAGAQLSILGEARVANWGPKDPEKIWLEGFERYERQLSPKKRNVQQASLLYRTLASGLEELQKLSEEWLLRKIADYEDEKTRIAAIFERINEGRIHFEVCNSCAERQSSLTHASPALHQYQDIQSGDRGRASRHGKSRTFPAMHHLQVHS
jgi:hypothetical protein